MFIFQMKTQIYTIFLLLKTGKCNDIGFYIWPWNIN